MENEMYFKTLKRLLQVAERRKKLKLLKCNSQCNLNVVLQFTNTKSSNLTREANKCYIIVNLFFVLYYE